MLKRIEKSLTAILLILLVFSSSSFTAQNRTQPRRQTVSAKPKLVVLLIVDQFRYDFLERFDDLFGKDGFHRLESEGANFTNANYAYTPTYTACGHAAIGSGSVPAGNGIVGNTWFDRATGKIRVMVSDPDSRTVTMKGAAETAGSYSPKNLLGTTLGDQLRMATNFRAKTIGISLKDRSAILPVGQRPTGAYWFSAVDGTFVTSDYYVKELPAWVKDFNTKNRPDRFNGMKWERALEESAYARAQQVNLPLQRTTLGNKFPYTLKSDEAKPGPKFYGAFEATPFANEYLAEFAKAAIEAEDLGADDATDMLSVSFSSTDLIGHSYGPDSQEVQDAFIRLDRVLADFLGYLDRKVGLQNTIIAVTSDHGVSPVPEYLKSLGFDAGRISTNEAVATVTKALNEKYGKEEKWIQSFVNDQFYIDPQLVARYKADPAEVERVVGDAAMTVPGIVTYYTRTQLTGGCMLTTPIARRVALGFNRQRSGDVWVVTKPFFFFAEGLATTHGSPYNYDAHVPVIFFGKGIAKGRFGIEASPSDIAPTIAFLLGIEMPSNRVGQVLPVNASAAGLRE